MTEIPEVAKLSATTCFYFFSTAAQCQAAIAALSLVAVQMRVSFLDEKVTAAKKATASYWVSVNLPMALEFEMARHEASEILDKAKSKIAEGSKIPTVESLARAINKLQSSRKTSRVLVAGILVATFFSIVQIPFSEFFETLEYGKQKGVLMLNIFFLALETILMAKAIGSVLGIRTKLRVPPTALV